MPRSRRKPAFRREEGLTAADIGPAILKRPPGDSQYRLPLAEVSPASHPTPDRSANSERLWFAVYLPSLPLDAMPPSERPRVLVEERQGIHRVLLADTDALEAGVMPDQSASAALALMPDIELLERSLPAERETLERLAGWLERFSSCVSLAGPDMVVLEIARSLRLFGGLKTLRRQIALGLDAQGYRTGVAITPTPLSAIWLARDGRRACIRNAANILPALRQLSLVRLDWPASVTAALEGMGVRTVGECLRLPREGFAKRFGRCRLRELDQALGRLPDPRRAWRTPERFVADYEMTEEQSDREILLAICKSLLEQQERFLLLRQQGTQRIRLEFFHLRAPASSLEVGAAELERRAHHWFDLLSIRFEQLTLPEPVIAVRLESGKGRALRRQSASLALGREPGRTLNYSMRQLAERLTARLGSGSIHGVHTVAEHRPQYAWQTADVLTGIALSTSEAGLYRSSRPLWMLPSPEPLTMREGCPWHEGPLKLLSGPERLETGWWDDDGISRDYYQACSPRGRRLWVFRVRERRQADAGHWYLHGYFG